MAQGGKIRCKLDASGHPASCTMPAFGEPKAGEVDVPFTPPDMSQFREQFSKGEFKTFDKGQWKNFDTQVFVETNRAREEAMRARGEAMRARAIDARKLGELGRKQGELERRAAELTARNASAAEISAARAAADANRAQLDAEAKRVADEAAKLGADVRVRVAPRGGQPPAPDAPKARP
jgi:membrane protein involved in colicin uptake